MKKYREAMNEVVQIIDLLSEEDRNKIPKNVIEYFRKNQSTSYEKVIVANESLKNQNISDRAKVMMAFVATYF